MKNWRTGRGGWAGVAVCLAVAGCGGEGEVGAGAASGTGTDANPSAAMLSSMLTAGGTVALPPAQEFSLPELGFDLGAPTAPIKVIEFSDYGCGFCRRFHTETFPGLQRDYIDTGRVQWKYVTYVSGMFANGLPAAFAAECAGEQELFAPVSRALYERQSEWKGLGDPVPFFQTLAAEAGADPGQFASCLAEQRPRGRVRSGMIAGGRLGVRGTPSFLVDVDVTPPLWPQPRAVIGAQPREQWDTIFISTEAEIGRMEAGGAAGETEPPPKPRP